MTRAWEKPISRVMHCDSCQGRDRVLNTRLIDCSASFLELKGILLQRLPSWNPIGSFRLRVAIDGSRGDSGSELKEGLAADRLTNDRRSKQGAPPSSAPVRQLSAQRREMALQALALRYSDGETAISESIQKRIHLFYFRILKITSLPFGDHS